MKGDTALFSRLFRFGIKPILHFLKKAVWKLYKRLLNLGARIYYKRSPYFKEYPTRSFEELKKNKGAYGEYLLCYRLKSEKGRWLFNLYLPGREEQTEIDALFICKRGVFLFESKNFKGRIYGRFDQRDWVQSIKTEKGIRKLRFFNPMMQNSAHKHALWSVLGKDIPLYPMVVFGDEAQLYTDDLKAHPEELFTISKLLKRVRSYPSTVLEEKEIEVLYSKLYPYTQVSSYEKYAHIRRAEQKRR